MWSNNLIRRLFAFCIKFLNGGEPACFSSILWIGLYCGSHHLVVVISWSENFYWADMLQDGDHFFSASSFITICNVCAYFLLSSFTSTAGHKPLLILSIYFELDPIHMSYFTTFFKSQSYGQNHRIPDISFPDCCTNFTFHVVAIANAS